MLTLNSSILPLNPLCPAGPEKVVGKKWWKNWVRTESAAFELRVNRSTGCNFSNAPFLTFIRAQTQPWNPLLAINTLKTSRIIFFIVKNSLVRNGIEHV